MRGFKPDIMGTALLLVIYCVGQTLVAWIFMDADTLAEQAQGLSFLSDSSAYRFVLLIMNLAYDGVAAIGFIVCILIFGVRGRKLVSIAPLVLLLAPILFELLVNVAEWLPGSSMLAISVLWGLTSGVAYGVALAAWAYGFGRSIAGVILAGCLGAVALTAFRFVAAEWMSQLLVEMPGIDRGFAAMVVVDIVGYALVIVGVIALSCVVGPGLARAPIATGPNYSPNSAPFPGQYPGQSGPQYPHGAQAGFGQPQYGQSQYGQPPAAPPRYEAGGPEQGQAWGIGDAGQGESGGAST